MNKPIVFFDGVCNLCNKAIQFIIKRDAGKKFQFASLQGKKGQEILQQHNLPSDTFNSFILLENEKIYTRSTAVLRMLRTLGGGWQLLYGFIVLPRFIRDPLYNLIARNRYKWFGKKEECWIPTPELKERFLN
ncbi:MAG: thiol-disulfide oxidoreductase DCC family protein [Chitinophagaceae bacterium]